jgi:hypothetical protein
MPSWGPCPGCAGWWCRLHQQHADSCSCPPVDGWQGDPYGDGCARAAWDDLLVAARIVLASPGDDLGEALGWLADALAVLDGDALT